MEVYEIYTTGKKGNRVHVGTYYVYSRRSSTYEPTYEVEKIKAMIPDARLMERVEANGSVPFIQEMLSEDNRDMGLKKHVYRCGRLIIIRQSRRTDANFLVYRCGVSEGADGYSPVDHSAPHKEGPCEVRNMQEWVCHYSFHRMDDDTYEAELDEAWYWGGSHLDGGTITRGIPEEWFSLPYDEFLAQVITLASAAHYGFTVDELKSKTGLRSFFGYPAEI